MRHLSCLAALALLVAPLAHANTYTFSFSGQDPQLADQGIYAPYNERFTIDPSVRPTIPPDRPSFACDDANCFTASSSNGTSEADHNFERDGIITELDDPYTTPGEYLNVLTYGTSTPLTLFTGSSDAPVLATGTFGAYVYFPGESYSPQGILTIVESPATTSSPVPEPSTFALLGTGALGLASTLRRRFGA